MPTPRFLLPYIETQQAQKEVTHAEGLNRLDAIICTAVQSRIIGTPPVTVLDGQMYLLPSSPTGAWAGQGGKVAQFLAGSWRFYAPVLGLSIWVFDEQTQYIYNGTTWIQNTIKATDPISLPSYTITTLPVASPAGRLIFVTNTTTGAKVVYSDGTKWRILSTDALIN